MVTLLSAMLRPKRRDGALSVTSMGVGGITAKDDPDLASAAVLISSSGSDKFGAVVTGDELNPDFLRGGPLREGDVDRSSTDRKDVFPVLCPPERLLLSQSMEGDEASDDEPEPE